MTLTKTNMKFNNKHKIIAAVALVAIIGLFVYRQRSKPLVTSKPLTPQGTPTEASDEMNAIGKTISTTPDYEGNFNGNLAMLAKHASITDYNNFATAYNNSKSLPQFNAAINVKYPKQRNKYLSVLVNFVNGNTVFGNKSPITTGKPQKISVFDYLKSSQSGIIAMKQAGKGSVGQ